MRVRARVRARAGARVSLEPTVQLVVEQAEPL